MRLRRIVCFCTSDFAVGALDRKWVPMHSDWIQPYRLVSFTPELTGSHNCAVSPSSDGNVFPHLHEQLPYSVQGEKIGDHSVCLGSDERWYAAASDVDGV